MKRIIRVIVAAALVLILTPLSASAEILSIRQTIFGMD